MKSGAQPSLPKLELEILGYLLRNPSSEDSIEGIVEWWLLEQRIMQANQDVREALAKLHQRGFVESRAVAGGKTVYRLIRQNRAAAAAACQRVRRKGASNS